MREKSNLNFISCKFDYIILIESLIIINHAFRLQFRSIFNIKAGRSNTKFTFNIQYFMESKEQTSKVTHKTPKIKLSNSVEYSQIKSPGIQNSKLQTADINKDVNNLGKSSSSSSMSLSHNSTHLADEPKKRKPFAKTETNLKTEQDQLVISDGGSESESSLSKELQAEISQRKPTRVETKQTARVVNQSNDSDGDSSPSRDSTGLKEFVENVHDGNDNEITTLNGQTSDKMQSDEDRDKVEDHSNVRLPNWKDLAELDSLPLVRSGYSIEADMKFGWKPTVKGKVLPIPFIFDSEDHYFDLEHFVDPKSKTPLPTIFLGFRPRDSFKLYRQLLQIVHPYHGTEIKLKIPSKLPPQVEKLLDAQMQNQVLGGTQDLKSSEKRIVGMQPNHKQLTSMPNVLQFDSLFECGNLDRVVMVNPNEYDLYMRPDTNTRGHHQWFYFRTIAKKNLGPVKFNILNFTKSSSLHEVGMKVCFCSAHEKSQLLKLAAEKQTGVPPTRNDDLGWKRGCYNISYDRSKLNEIIRKHNGEDYDDEESLTNNRIFYQLSFTYDFNLIDGDEVYFAQSFPYSFTRLSNYIKELKSNKDVMSHLKDSTPICHSLSGIDIPYLIVTSRVNQDNFNEIDPNEHSKQNQPPDKFKKTIVITSRVHPGETNASFMMEGFLNFITSTSNEKAIELRKRIVFKIIPCVNPDGVIAGNYRVSMSGNDLNRRYKTPHPKLHPVVCAIKKLISEESGPNVMSQEENKKVIAYIDIHGHSRKKSVFMYGPEFPIHDARYLKMKIIPKIMSEQGDMFRFYSCKFRFQKSKEKTARIVLWKEFNITNCYTLEASMMGYFDQQRETRQFVQSHFYLVGRMLVQSIFEFVLIREDERKQIKARQELQKQKEEMQKMLLRVPTKTNASPTKKQSSNSVQKPLSSRNILSPSASSEAILPAQDNSDGGNEITQLVKKKKAPALKDKKKTFNVTKKYKDDPLIKDPIPPNKSEKKVANPNEPEQQENDSFLNDDNTSHDFISQFRQQKRTFQDLCNEIEKDDDKQESSEENVTTDKDNQIEGQSEDFSQRQKKVKKPHQSDCDSDSEDDELMMKIHSNIIGLINATNTGGQEKSKKVVQTKEPSKKQPRLYVARVASGKKNPKLDNKKLEEKKITVLPKAKKLTNIEYNSQSDIQKSDLKPKSSNQSRIRRTESKLHQPSQRKSKMASEMETKKQVYQNVTPAVVYPAQSIAMNCNNFNDRIMNEQYSKHKAPYNHQVYQLSTLSSGAQKLLNKHLANDQLRRMQMIEQQNQRAIQKEKEKNFTIYNFQSKKVEKHNLMDVNMSISNLSSGRGSLERPFNGQKVANHDDFFDQQHQQILDKLNESSPSRYTNEPFFMTQNQSPKAILSPSQIKDHNSQSSSDSLQQFSKFVGMGTSQRVQNSNAHPILSHPPNFNGGKIQIKRTGLISSPLRTDFPLKNEILSHQNSKQRSTEHDEPLITTSQNQRNRRLVPVDQSQTLNKIQPLLSKSPDFKPRQAKMTLGSSFFQEISNDTGLYPDKIIEQQVEESPMIGLGIPQIAQNFQLKFQQTLPIQETNEPQTIEGTHESQPTPEDDDFRKQLNQEAVFAQRGLSSQVNDSRYIKSTQFKQMNQSNISALYASMDINRNKKQMPGDYFQQPKVIEGTKSPPEQATIEMSTSHRLKYIVQPGHKKVQSTIYMTDQKPIQNITSEEQQKALLRGRTTTNPGSRLSLVQSTHQTQQHSPQNSPLKIKTRQNQVQTSKNNDYQQFQERSGGMQTIKSQLLAQSEIAKFKKQKQTKKSNRSDMIYNSIKHQKFQSLLNQQDFSNLQQEKSTNLIKDKIINNQEQQIPPNTVNLKTSKTINFAARDIGQYNSVSTRQQQQQNQYIYQQKLINVNKSKQLQPGQFYPYAHKNQQQMQRNNQQKLQRNVYNDLQELQRELNQMEPPVKNTKSYSNQFQHHSNNQQVITDITKQSSFHMKGNSQRNQNLIKIQDRAFQSQDNNNILTQMISHQNLNMAAATENSPGVRAKTLHFQEEAGSPGPFSHQHITKEVRIPMSGSKAEQPMIQLHLVNQDKQNN